MQTNIGLSPFIGSGVPAEVLLVAPATGDEGALFSTFLPETTTGLPDMTVDALVPVPVRVAMPIAGWVGQTVTLPISRQVALAEKDAGDFSGRDDPPTIDSLHVLPPCGTVSDPVAWTPGEDPALAALPDPQPGLVPPLHVAPIPADGAQGRLSSGRVATFHRDAPDMPAVPTLAIRKAAATPSASDVPRLANTVLERTNHSATAEGAAGIPLVRPAPNGPAPDHIALPHGMAETSRPAGRAVPTQMPALAPAPDVDVLALSNEQTQSRTLSSAPPPVLPPAPMRISPVRALQPADGEAGAMAAPQVGIPAQSSEHSPSPRSDLVPMMARVPVKVSGLPPSPTAPEGAVTVASAAGVSLWQGAFVPEAPTPGAFGDVLEAAPSLQGGVVQKTPSAPIETPTTTTPSKFAAMELALPTAEVSSRFVEADPALIEGWPAASGPSAGPLTAPASVTTVAQPAIPQLAARIVETLVHRADGTTELALSPDELGRVSVSLQADAQNPERMVVMLSFDRPETLDLFRRHADQLADALRAAGYSGADIGFGHSGAGPGNGGNKVVQGDRSGATPDDVAPPRNDCSTPSPCRDDLA